VLGREGRAPTAIGAVLRMRTDIFEDACGLRPEVVGSRYKGSNPECFEALALRHSRIQVQNAGTSHEGIGPPYDGRERISRFDYRPRSNDATTASFSKAF
jgi:hypothetical protein